jgi:hypothetical protein
MLVKAAQIKPGTRLRFSAGWNHEPLTGTAYGRYRSSFYEWTCTIKVDNGTWCSILDAYTDPADRSANGSPIGWFYMDKKQAPTP